MKKIIYILIFNIQFFFFQNAQAQPGVIDSTFGVDGIVQAPIVSSHVATCRKVIPLSNGKILAVGNAFTGTQTEFAMTRLLNNGTVDISFGSQGITTTAINGSNASIGYSAVIQQDGKIVLGGNFFDGFGYNFAAVRYDSSGVVDNTFGIGGVSTIAVGNGLFDDTGYDIALQSNGKILIAGKSFSGNDYDFTVVRFKTDGVVDSTFGINGASVIPVTSGDDICYAMVVQNDDKVVLSGNFQINGYRVFAVARLTADGQPDATFGAGGFTTAPLGSTDDDFGYAVIMQQPDNKIIVGGATNFSGSYDFAMLRFDSLGALDNSFGNAGVVLTDFSGSGSDDYAYDILIQQDGKILLAGKTNDLGSRFGLARYDSNGAIDNTFGTLGMTTVNLTSSQHNCYSAAIDINNKILLGGRVSAFNDFIIARVKSGLLVSVIETELPINNNLLVYPNPAASEFVITSRTGLLSAGKKVALKVLDINGKELYKEQFLNAEQINMSVEFPAGIYIIQLQDDYKVETQKLIIR